MSSKHERTLAALFEDPVRTDILWNEVISLLRNLGATIVNRAGSRVAAKLAGRTLVLHRPHPGKELHVYAVSDLRAFLTEAGVQP